MKKQRDKSANITQRRNTSIEDNSDDISPKQMESIDDISNAKNTSIKVVCRFRPLNEKEHEIENNCFEYRIVPRTYETKATNTNNEIKPNVIEQQGFEYKTPITKEKRKALQPNQIENESFELNAPLKNIKKNFIVKAPNI